MITLFKMTDRKNVHNFVNIFNWKIESPRQCHLIKVKYNHCPMDNKPPCTNSIELLIQLLIVKFVIITLFWFTVWDG
jgi:hypothetical protein